MNVQLPSERPEFLGLRFDTLTQGEVLAWVLHRAQGSVFSYVVTPNVDHVVQLHRHSDDDELWSSYEEAGLCLCDSRVLQAIAQLSGTELKLFPGSDLTAQLLRLPAARDKKIAVIGGDNQVFKALVTRFPGADWHQHSPPMGVRSDPRAQQEIIDFIEATAADLVFVAIGAPQSELICRQIALRGRARGVALCIGASLEFITGAKKRAPLLIQRLKLEWLFRLCVEPRRLGRRYVVEGPRIFKIAYLWQRGRSRSPDGCGSKQSDAK